MGESHAICQGVRRKENIRQEVGWDLHEQTQNKNPSQRACLLGRIVSAEIISLSLPGCPVRIAAQEGGMCCLPGSLGSCPKPPVGHSRLFAN